MPFKADEFIGSVNGPLATVKYCKVKGCEFRVKYAKGMRGAGRGYGLREGGRAISAMRRHIRDHHPELME